jgi:hypothetical protein
VHHDPTPESARRFASPQLTPEQLRLLDKVLDSIEKLELARHLTEARFPLLASELQARARLEPAVMRTTLAELVRAQVIQLIGEPEPMVRLAPRARRADFEALMRLYAADPAAVVSALTSIAVARIRVMAVHTFNKAFVLKKRRKGEPRDG